MNSEVRKAISNLKKFLANSKSPSSGKENCRILVTESGSIAVDRESLHKSDAYGRQRAALQQLESKLAKK